MCSYKISIAEIFKSNAVSLLVSKIIMPRNQTDAYCHTIFSILDL